MKIETKQLSALGSRLYLMLLAVFALVLSATPAQTASATMVTDLNSYAIGTTFVSFASASNQLFFLRDSGSPELWKSDGTADGTSLVASLDIEKDHYGNYDIVLIGGANRLFFALGGGAQPGLWLSDGTTAGTTRILSATPEAPVREFALVGNTIYFSAVDTLAGRELWMSDGTPSGTRRVADIRLGSAGSNPSSLTAMGERVFFVAEDGINGPELWVSDGSESGTLRLTSLASHSWGDNIGLITATTNHVFFVVSDDTSHTLWVSDGSVAGTRQLMAWARDLSGMSPEDLTAMGDRLFFRLTPKDPSNTSGEIWVSDGQTGVTARVRSFNDTPLGLTAVGQRLYFTVYDPAWGEELWTSDGSAAGTTIVRDIVPGAGSSTPYFLIALGGSLYFAASLQQPSIPNYQVALWRSDGSPSGTVELHRYTSRNDEKSEAPIYLTAVGSRMFFVAGDREAGSELWVSDGTPGGTVRVKDITTPGYGSDPTAMATTYNQLFFKADDGDHGYVFWALDRGGVNVQRILDLPYSKGATVVFGPWIIGAQAFFGVQGAADYDGLWVSNGTPGGTYLLNRGFAESYNSSRPATVVGGNLLFSGTGAEGEELWTTDGAVEGTRRLKSFGAVSLVSLTTVGKTVFFVEHNTGRARLWKSDGTADGTVLVSSRTIGLEFSGPQQLTAAGNRLFFVVESEQTGSELWVSDGTDAGTRLARDIQPGAGSSYPSELTPYGNTINFAADDGQHGCALWRSDGTADGTWLVKNIAGGQINPYGETCPSNLIVASSGIFFGAYDAEHGRELWISDGTTDGTRLVKDIRPGSESSGLDSPAVIYGRLLFSADDGVHGAELWQSDGSTGGTQLILDLVPGPDGAGPYGIRRLGSQIFFAADDGIHGAELWKMPLQDLGIELHSVYFPVGASAR